MAVEKRRDNKGRLLRTGELQMKDGRYRFKYKDSNGEIAYAYSDRLDVHDPIPVGKKKKISLREMEKDIKQKLAFHLVTNAGKLTVNELVDRYIGTRVNSVRHSTRAGYTTVQNLLKNESFGKKRIDSVKILDAKEFIIKLQKEDEKSYSSIHTIRGVLRPAFQMAVDDDMILKNPFDFPLQNVIYDDSEKREAISPEQERKFLNFIKGDKHFSKYYEGIFILFNTGLRISEFCGLTISDIDFKTHRINVDHQLKKVKDDNKQYVYYIEDTKASGSDRTLPMSSEVEECFKTIIKNRKPPKIEPCIGGKSGFLYFDKNGNITHALHWEHYFQHILEKYNSIYKEELPTITPHVCRHTYCTKMAKKRISPKSLQYLMGHSGAEISLNIYTSWNIGDVEEELGEIEVKEVNEEADRNNGSDIIKFDDRRRKAD
ncbi:MAG: site-specific integrase [Eubacterium sp.]|nr:site-specific integrase [Eubacterium sp.]